MLLLLGKLKGRRTTGRQTEHGLTNAQQTARIEERWGEERREKNNKRGRNRVALAFEGMGGDKTEKKEGRRGRWGGEE